MSHPVVPPIGGCADDLTQVGETVWLSQDHFDALIAGEGRVQHRAGAKHKLDARPFAALEEADAMARHLMVVLGEPFALEQYDVSVGASVGIAAYPDHGADPDTLLRRADVAMYVAKRSGLGRAVYAMEQDEHSRDRLELTADLKRAIEQGELRLHYQPIVSLKTGRMEEVEALVRWQHPKRGLVPPSVFIPIAEETGVIVQIGRWVLEEACRQAVIWQERYRAGRSVVMSVNISARQVHQTDFPAEVKEVLRATGMDPRSLKLEITESVAMENAERNIATLWLLKGMGIRLAIDDFGTGYSSLGYLKRFPVDTLKIDKVFVDGLGVHPEDSAVIAAIIAFAHAVGLSTTAEGVEEAGQLAHLQKLRADRIQGYFCSKPLPAEALNELLRAPSPLLERRDLRPKTVGRRGGNGTRLSRALPPRAA
jgi:EAL domain-containing protein (putative c-di-GMP-specific phosphodiesterase class I)